MSNKVFSIMKQQVITLNARVATIGDTRSQKFTSFDDLTEQFIAEIDAKPSTRGQYRKTVKLFFDWVVESGRNLQSLTRADIIAYRDNLLISSGHPTRTVKTYLQGVRAFYKWTEGRRIYPNIASDIRVKNDSSLFQKKPLSAQQTRDLLAVAQTNADKATAEQQRHDIETDAELTDKQKVSKLNALNRQLARDDEKTARNYAIINLIARTGLRTIEVSRANVGDIDVEFGQPVLRVQGKGRNDKTESVALSDKALQPIKDYLSKYRKGANVGEPLFVSTSNRHGVTDQQSRTADNLVKRDATGKRDSTVVLSNRLSTRSISQICKDGLKSIGMGDRQHTAHALRHTCGFLMIGAGASVQDVQHVLRHRSPVTTEIYIHLQEQEKRFTNAPEKVLDNIF